MEIVFAAVMGLLLGSFMNVLLDRWPHWQGVVRGRSQCPHCGRVLTWYELVPLVSWLWLRGRCRTCHAPISARYLIGELAVGAVFAAYAWQWGIGAPGTGVELAMLFGFTLLLFFDARFLVLPDVVLLPMVVVALVARSDVLIIAISMALVLAGVFGALYAASRGRWLGLGDVKLAAVIGLWFWLWAPSVTLIAIWGGALISVLLLVLGRVTRKTPMPFGAFWSAAALAMMLWPAPFARLNELIFVTLFGI